MEENGYYDDDDDDDVENHKDENNIEYRDEYYYANGDGDGDEKEEFLKCNGGDGIILNHFVGWYFFLYKFSISVFGMPHTYSN